MGRNLKERSNTVGYFSWVDSNIYCRVFERLYIPFNKSKYGGYARLVQDNAPSHISKKTKEKLREWKVGTLDWPPESPDLNPIEVIWEHMKNEIRKKGPRTPSELKKAIVGNWQHLTPEVCTKYIEGIKAGLRQVVQQKGGNIIKGRRRTLDENDT
ncbi:hypothetical protein ANCCAN_05709 [Ancylostoma caninum]|uniref:Tc1-like transposase DDE domain-containing protein n=1 Tax=Ancylostoma caninum TaxID=29170 RepID=A0A368GV18_ANCCA|nr:hypothetical protein ANCCAN_05709 [Ancylostoma caninum]